MSKDFLKEMVIPEYNFDYIVKSSMNYKRANYIQKYLKYNFNIST